MPEIGVWLALLLAAALAPTDAGLGAATVLNPVVPVRIRRVLNVESGLNDGLATPVVLFAVGPPRGPPTHTEHALVKAVLEIVIGIAVGAAAGFLTGRLLDIAHAQGWSHRARSRWRCSSCPCSPTTPPTPGRQRVHRRVRGRHDVRLGRPSDLDRMHATSN